MIEHRGTMIAPRDGADGSVELSRRFDAPPERVWAHWTDPERMAAWLGPVEGTPGPGAEFVLRMEPEASATCAVTAWDPPALLELVWHYTGEPPTTVRVELAPDAGGTLLRLRHERTDLPLDYLAGWHAELDLLAAELSGRPHPDFHARYQALRKLYAEGS